MSANGGEPVIIRQEKRDILGKLATIWKYKSMLPTALATIVGYYTVGPPLETWTLGISLMSALARQANVIQSDDPVPNEAEAREAAISRRETMNKILSKPFQDGVGYEVRIPVKELGLKGLLEKADREEDGSREVPAEWQLHDQAQSYPSNRVVLFLHGGAYVIMSPVTHRTTSLNFSRVFNARVLSVDYRLAPETVFPGGLHDSVAAYLYLTADLGVDPASIIVAGDSAGGGLTLALLLYLRDNDMPLPGGAVLQSPWCDLTKSFRSWEENAKYDFLFMPPIEHPTSQARHYLGPDNLHNLTHPCATSCFADLEGLPPLLITAGGSETLRDEATMLAHRAHAAGVDVTYQIFQQGLHVFQARPYDASVAAYEAMDEWYKKQKAVHSANKAKFGDIDQRLREELAARLEKDGVGSGKGPSPKRKFIFEPVERDAPVIELRDMAHELARKALAEDHARGPPKGITTVFVPRRNRA